MKVTQVGICPSQASRKAGRPELTPELLAASGARYSRNNEGLESILSRIDPANLEKSVESIFRMVDYGHQSIADMVPVAMFVDGISIWLAYYLWTLCPTAGGQESSTRYLKISPEGLVPPEVLGIAPSDVAAWQDQMRCCFNAYQACITAWEKLANQNPGLTGIPRSLLEESSEAAQKKVARMRRNYAFDRARYFLPVAAATNVMMIMSARGWVNLCQWLLSHPLSEPRRLGAAVRDELEICAPRMLRHAKASPANERSLDDEFQRLVAVARSKDLLSPHPSDRDMDSARPFLAVMPPGDASPAGFAADLAHHHNRYAPMGTFLQRTAVRFGWSAIGFAEIRDLNRHRTGSKYCPQVPRGFYFALDQVPDGEGAHRPFLVDQAKVGFAACRAALERLQRGEASYLYWSVLGTEYPFEHTTTADKFIYEAELRTGLGAHFRYARHLRDVLGLWYEKMPETRGLILEGSAEPE